MIFSMLKVLISLLFFNHAFAIKCHCKNNEQFIKRWTSLQANCTEAVMSRMSEFEQGLCQIGKDQNFLRSLNTTCHATTATNTITNVCELPSTGRRNGPTCANIQSIFGHFKGCFLYGSGGDNPRCEEGPYGTMAICDQDYCVPPQLCNFDKESILNRLGSKSQNIFAQVWLEYPKDDERQ